jgi:serine/threonine protein phosphatase PrpC
LVRGANSDTQQKSFADKATAKGGDELFMGAKIGYACKKGLKPESPNQDDFCILMADSTSVFAVFDGHGPYGHDLSGFVQEHLPHVFIRHPSFRDDPEKALGAAFAETHRLCIESQAECRFDCALSGTTATLAMQRDGRLHLAHVGDSRAVLARKQGNGLRAEELTVDHKPTCECERTRIQAAGGEVRRLEGDIPHRVFLPGKMYPGLSMTRSIGDTVGSTAGVTSTPEVRSLQVEDDWRFLLFGSDGIWEFINSQEAVDMIGKYSPSNVQKAIDSLAAEAWSRWLAEEKDVVDDITVICVWIKEDVTIH